MHGYIYIYVCIYLYICIYVYTDAYAHMYIYNSTTRACAPVQRCSSFLAMEIQPRNSHRLGLIRDGRLFAHNCRVFETAHIPTWKVHLTPPDRGIGLSGAQLFNNLKLNPLALLTPSPFRWNLVHLNISGCQSINTSAIDTLLRLSHADVKDVY